MENNNSELIVKKILTEIRLYENGQASESMHKLGLKYSKNYGVSIRDLKEIAKNYYPSNILAKKLRSNDIRETKILADMIDDIKQLNEENLEEIIHLIDTHELAEQICINLLEKTELSYNKIKEWIKSENENILTIAFILYSRFALINKELQDSFFVFYFPYAVLHSDHQNIHLRKAIARALRQTAMRNKTMHLEVLKVIEDIKLKKTKNSKLIIEEVLPLIS